MTRYAKKYQFDRSEDKSYQRSHRKSKGNKFAQAINASKTERRHGWGYAKRRAVLNED